MFRRIAQTMAVRARKVARRPDRGMETLEFVLWAAGILAVIAVLVVLVGNKLDAFWNSLDFGQVG
jgi:hypothetical protein